MNQASRKIDYRFSINGVISFGHNLVLFCLLEKKSFVCREPQVKFSILMPSNILCTHKPQGRVLSLEKIIFQTAVKYGAGFGVVRMISKVWLLRCTSIKQRIFSRSLLYNNSKNQNAAAAAKKVAQKREVCLDISVLLFRTGLPPFVGSCHSNSPCTRNEECVIWYLDT